MRIRHRGHERVHLQQYAADISKSRTPCGKGLMLAKKTRKNKQDKTSPEMAWWCCLLILAALVVYSGIPGIAAQVGVTLCACSPATYTFQLNFTYICNETTIEGAGLNNTECFVSPFGFDPENVTGTSHIQ
jgi:hypothetical protein